MSSLIQKIINKLIISRALIQNYPESGVSFQSIDPFFNDPNSRQILSEAVITAIKTVSFDAVAGIASRGFLFSGIIASHLKDKGEHFIQKVKVKDHPHFVQLNTQTEYSSDALQVLKNTIEVGKKYLLTDDLIATGGSVMTAIKLIRACGGVVDTVFVMTELVDLGAKEKLLKEGVELTSLLKLTNADLDKLLLLQRCYTNQPDNLITYQLTHHTKADQHFLGLNNSVPLRINLASQSMLKKDATQLAFQGMFDPLNIEVISHECASNVNNQPYGEEETVRGANNRLNDLLNNSIDLDNSIIVSMENGIRFSTDDQSYYDFVHVIVKHGDHLFAQSENCCKIPDSIISNMLEKNRFDTTWGEVAVQMGLAKQANNPHQEPCFGGISRTDILLHVLCQVLGKVKQKILGEDSAKQEDQKFTINRVADLNINQSKNKYAKRGIFFTPPTDAMNSRPINFYNQGAPVGWAIDPDKIARNQFKVFSTGDAFSIMSANVDINGANIIIHIGLEHPNYSPLVLLQEGLQLCRCAYEQGARSITIALPDQFHPVVHYNDFSMLIMSLFKASGANRVYFYDKNYTGKLEDNYKNATIPLIITKQADPDDYQISKQDLLNYLHCFNDSKPSNDRLSLDYKVMHFNRKSYFNRSWCRFGAQQSDISTTLFGNEITAAINIPELKAQQHVLLSCSANKPLAYKIAASLRMKGEIVRVYPILGEGETATIPDHVAICGAVVTIVQSTRPNPDCIKEVQKYQINGASSYLFEAASIARQAHLRGAETINLINPYQFSARSDKAEANPRGKTGAYVQLNGLLFEAAGVNQVVTAECHDMHTISGSYTGKKIKGSAVAALTIIATKIAQEWLNTADHSRKGQLRLVAPDAGAAKRTKELTQQLQTILGNNLCETRILGDKQRDSHEDNSALINSLNSGDIHINPYDKYMITDDETATGTTLGQAITNLKKNGAEDIEVIVVHNNMPLDWLTRQLCLARFLYLGVSNLHFTDTQEMGSLAKNYADLLDIASQRSLLPSTQIEAELFNWFKTNLSHELVNQSDVYLNQEFSRFKLTFNQFETNIHIHSLANEFANKVATKPYLGNPYAFEYKVHEYITKLEGSPAKSIVVFEGVSVAAAAATAQALALPLQIIPRFITGSTNIKLFLPQSPFALIGTPSELTLKTLRDNRHKNLEACFDFSNQYLDDDLAIITANPHDLGDKILIKSDIDIQSTLSAEMADLMEEIKDIYQKIKEDPKSNNLPVKLMGIGVDGQILAGKLAYLLNQNGRPVGIVAANLGLDHLQDGVIFSGQSGERILSADKSSLGMGDVCIALSSEWSNDTKIAVNQLATNAKVHCHHYCFLENQAKGYAQGFAEKQVDIQGTYAQNAPQLFFKSQPQGQVNNKECSNEAIQCAL